MKSYPNLKKKIVAQTRITRWYRLSEIHICTFIFHIGLHIEKEEPIMTGRNAKPGQNLVMLFLIATNDRLFMHHYLFPRFPHYYVKGCAR